MGSHFAESIAVEQGGLVTLDCRGSAGDLGKVYSDLVTHCLANHARKVLVRACGRDEAGYLQLRNALARLVLESGLREFRLALVGARHSIQAGFQTLQGDLRYIGIAIRWFESEQDAAAWLE